VDDLNPIVIGKVINPRTGLEEDDIVFRGFYITNSEVGKSSLKIAGGGTETTQPGERSCPAGYVVLDKPNQYGAFCEPKEGLPKTTPEAGKFGMFGDEKTARSWRMPASPICRAISSARRSLPSRLFAMRSRKAPQFKAKLLRPTMPPRPARRPPHEEKVWEPVESPNALSLPCWGWSDEPERNSSI
jgi:hypothetical protein